MTTLHPIGTHSPDATGDVVFVHGLDGDWKKTFLHANGFYWPDAVAEAVPQAHVWAVEYPAASTYWSGTAMGLLETSRAILRALGENRLGQRPLVFITHSLGGLITKHLLRVAGDLGCPEGCQAVATNTRAVAFLAVPHDGANLASFVRLARAWMPGMSWLLRDTPLLTDLQRSRDDLIELSRWYVLRARERGIVHRIFYETQPMKGMLVVTRDSARLTPELDAIEVSEDHLGICKPARTEDRVHRECTALVKEALRQSA